MQTNKNPRDQLWELQAMITKMPLPVFSSVVLPEFGLQWKEVSRAVRNCRLPMLPSSVGRVLCTHLAKSLPRDDLDDVLPRIRLKMVAFQTRTWHVLHLQGATDEARALDDLPGRVLAALRQRHKGGARPEVHSVMMGSLVYLSVRLVSGAKARGLFVAAPPGEPVALVSAAAGDKLLEPCVQGLGYTSYTVADLHGSHVPSLLRVARGAWGPAPGLVARYDPAPARTPTGIDYTHATYDQRYVDSVIGPDPPLLTELTIKTSSCFFDRARLDRSLALTLHIRSDSIARTLKCWALKGAISADSDLFKVLRNARANKITYEKGSDTE